MSATLTCSHACIYNYAWGDFLVVVCPLCDNIRSQKSFHIYVKGE
jgi:hypothetical protein